MTTIYVNYHSSHCIIDFKEFFIFLEIYPPCKARRSNSGIKSAGEKNSVALYYEEAESNNQVYQRVYHQGTG